MYTVYDDYDVYLYYSGPIYSWITFFFKTPRFLYYNIYYI